MTPYIRCHFFAKIVTVNVFLTKNVIFLNLVRKNSEHVAYISSAGNTMV